MPVGRVEVLDRFEFQPSRVNLPFQSRQFLAGPLFVRITGQSPAGVITDRLVAGLIAAGRAEVIHQVRHDVRAAALPGKAVVLLV